MLYLMRKQNESIIINNNIELIVVEVKGKSVKLGFTFPKDASVLRKELYDKIMAENKINMPGGFGGLMRFDEEYESVFSLKPTHVIGFVICIVAFRFILEFIY